MANNKHLTFEERIIIEEYLDKGICIHKIALKLNRQDSSIVREIKRNRYMYSNENKEYIPCRFRRSDLCERRHACGDIDCNNECAYCSISPCKPGGCKDYVPIECEYLSKSPFVCNGCDECKTIKQRCRKYKYSAKKAQISYLETLKSSREGITLSSEEMQLLDDLVSPLLKQGQSIRAVFSSHKDEIPCSESTLYRYVDNRYLSARNIDMPRKVRFKARYDHGPRAQSFQDFVTGRTYIDFKKYIDNNPDVNIWEMDTVIGTPGGKCLLTLLFQKTNFMLAILLNEHTQEAVINALNTLSEILGIKLFQKLFQVIITDRGTEFGNPYALECDENGELKTKVFYCDPYCSWQKGKIEKNHEFIRLILPKGKSFDNLTQSDIHLMMLHINNYPRESLNGTTPFELSKLLLGQEFLSKLHYHKIRQDDVILKPMLLKKPSDI